MISYEDKIKLEIVKTYSPTELKTILMFLEAEMFYDGLGQPYTRRCFRDTVNRFGAKND